MVAAVAAREARFLEILLAYGVLGIAARCILGLSVYRTSLTQFLTDNLLSSCVLGLLFAVISMLLRQRDTHRARRLIAPDRRRYDAVWADLIRDAAAAAALSSVRGHAAELARAMPRTNGPPRQYAPRKPGDMPTATPQAWWAGWWRWRASDLCGLWRRASEEAGEIPSLQALESGREALQGCRSRAEAASGGSSIAAGGAEGFRKAEPTRKRVDCLGQLLVQATLMHPLLLGKVQRWARESRGCFPVAADGDADGVGDGVRFVR